MSYSYSFPSSTILQLKSLAFVSSRYLSILPHTLQRYIHQFLRISQLIPYHWLYTPLRISGYQSTADLNSACSQTDSKDQPASLGVTCDQHVKFRGRCWICRLGLPLQNHSYTNFLTMTNWNWCTLPGINVGTNEREAATMSLRHNSEDYTLTQKNTIQFLSA